jgi:hypothetical protein
LRFVPVVFRFVAAPVEVLAAGVAFAADRERVAVLRFGRATGRAVLVDARLADVPPLSSIGHLPDNTLCAASATASAISEPSLVALAVTDFAARSAVSAASIPASLIALRAFGLALIAAAAAASPAASISLLIAAFASLSIVSDFLEEFEVLERLGDFAIANLRFRFAH